MSLHTVIILLIVFMLGIVFHAKFPGVTAPILGKVGLA